MSEIRHDRPIFKYLDNLRRENQPNATSNIFAASKSSTEESVPRRLTQPMDEKAYARHFQKFDELPEQSKAVIANLVEVANSYIQAQLEYIESIGNGKRTGKRKSKFEAESASLRGACEVFNLHCEAELNDGKSATRDWWAKLRVVMGAEWAGFEDIDELIKENR